MHRFLLVLLMIVTACESGEAPMDQPRNDTSGTLPGPESAGGLGVDRSRAGTPAPDVEFEDPDGDPASVAGFRGKPLLLNLWATWCAPCIKELPTLDALAVREGERLQVVTLAEDERDKVEAFLAARNFRSLEAWVDPELTSMTALGVGTLPTTILYDAQGREIWRFTGDQDWTGKDAAALLAESRK
ncbi:TlpA family protein disulfide reductase [Allosphingosinicella deserti]|uniref:Thioredoxin domain-containing protein n=1 Tax=Allosphingosinicella deserti TaxID=2116704 RepID=A0A2P7QUK9_9SPHN|nr:TlpA disulfide reductase family protein [Sphingomonas deserti]PSJ41646.1 hypothetical protein C7I55_04910 [Sphingomonas deserti]